MKDLNEILSHLATIDKIDGHADASAYDRGRAVGVLVWNIVDELIAGRPAPCTRDVARFTRIEGLVPRLADELVEHHAEAIAHRTHLAERLEAEGGENGAKAAAILRGMNLVAQPVFIGAKLTKEQANEMREAFNNATPGGIVALPPFVQDFTGHQPRGQASDEVEAPRLKAFPYQQAIIDAASDPNMAEQLRSGMTKDESERMRKQLSGLWAAWANKASEVPDAPAFTTPAGIAAGLLSDRIQRYRAQEAARRERSLAKAAEEKIRAAEERGFYKGRGVALNIVLNRLRMMPGLHEDGQAVLRAVSESIAMMQKEG